MSKVVLREGGTVYVQEPGESDSTKVECVFNIDWLQLAQQKHRLLGLIWEDNDDILWGIIHLIDSIQDQGAEAGYPVVFIREASDWDAEHPQ